MALHAVDVEQAKPAPARVGAPIVVEWDAVEGAESYRVTVVSDGHRWPWDVREPRILIPAPLVGREYEVRVAVVVAGVVSSPATVTVRGQSKTGANRAPSAPIRLRVLPHLGVALIECRDCREMREPGQFVVHPNGHRYRTCRTCQNTRKRALYAADGSVIRVSAQSRAKRRYQGRPEIHTQRGPRDPRKLKARRTARDAVRDGHLQRQGCVVCGDPKVDAHHEDYDKPLDVVWLCRRHHGERHRRV